MPSTPEASKAHRLLHLPSEPPGLPGNRHWRSIRHRFAVVLASLVPSFVFAQEAVTVSGHVSTGNLPLQGANVGIASLDVSALTDENGRYSFIVSSSRVRGQRVTIAARRARYTTQSFEITLVGGSITQDFNLPPVGGAAAQPTVPE